eukprot:gnl/Ergobibamus_cyprinoides/2522.p1 GENE.gnl/Ergobibamus_cyprinoides/2522~~gnl/Ergobibamus_cyprinoides/2522.p1  ORF type:complete len:170 (-),score=69.88 gnl/Ergobibamus_cyprinoides/2522:185-658(-)
MSDFEDFEDFGSDNDFEDFGAAPAEAAPTAAAAAAAAPEDSLEDWERDLVAEEKRQAAIAEVKKQQDEEAARKAARLARRMRARETADEDPEELDVDALARAARKRQMASDLALAEDFVCSDAASASDEDEAAGAEAPGAYDLLADGAPAPDRRARR